MSTTLFSELNLTPEIARAVELMGFETATPIQAQCLPLIRSGEDVIGRSQTGTGKTVAFGIPAIEAVDCNAPKSGVQVLILCPTRELAMQAGEEIRKLARFMPEIQPVEIYGGAPIDKQCIRLRRANIVIGTPGRVMDHMRRKTIKLANLKMIVLDEADEMLNMGFKEDIETILRETPETHQTVLFSATMPPAIMAITQQFQHDPKTVEIDKAHVTLDNISQLYVDVPHSAKTNAIDLLLQYYRPRCAIVFCNTKSMVDELTAHLNENGISAEALHGDLKQSQRTSVMQSFKAGRVSVLVATDIAARGIDVSNVEYVINFDIPQNTEYYIHRIGRTGRAGKSGVSITITSSKREVIIMRGIAREVKSEINEMKIPTVVDVKAQNGKKTITALEAVLDGTLEPAFAEMVQELIAKGYTAADIAAAALQMSAEKEAPAAAQLSDIPAVSRDTRREFGARPRYDRKPGFDKKFGEKKDSHGNYYPAQKTGRGGKPFVKKEKGAIPRSKRTYTA